MQFEHRARTAHTPALAISDNEMDGEEEGRMLATRGGSNTSGKLKSANTSAIHRVIWPHEYVFTPDGQPAAYESLSSMAFVTSTCVATASEQPLGSGIILRPHVTT